MSQEYAIRELTEDKFNPLFKKHAPTLFAEDHSYRLRDLLGDDEKEKVDQLRKETEKTFKLHLAVFDKDENFVGWSWGYQEYSSTFYMCNSGVLNEHRRKGIYQALLDRCIEIVSEKGFQLIYSRHCATNNAVIIPKLKAGFLISKMEISDVFGVLVHLHYYPSADRRRIMDCRSGQQKPNAKIREIFKL